jgi:hypothetical protein
MGLCGGRHAVGTQASPQARALRVPGSHATGVTRAAPHRSPSIGVWGVVASRAGARPCARPCASVLGSQAPRQAVTPSLCTRNRCATGDVTPVSLARAPRALAGRSRQPTRPTRHTPAPAPAQSTPQAHAAWSPQHTSGRCKRSSALSRALAALEAGPRSSSHEGSLLVSAAAPAHPPSAKTDTRNQQVRVNGGRTGLVRRQRQAKKIQSCPHSTSGAAGPRWAAVGSPR